MGDRNVLNNLRQEGWSEKTKALVFNLFLIGVFAYALIEASTFPRNAAAFPLVVGFLGLAATVWPFFTAVKSLGASPEQESKSESNGIQSDLVQEFSMPTRLVYAKAGKFLSWLLGYYLGIMFVGQLLATFILLVTFIRITGKARWWVSVTIALVEVYIIFGVIANAFEVTWPTGIFNLLADPLPMPGFSTFYF